MADPKTRAVVYFLFSLAVFLPACSPARAQGTDITLEDLLAVETPGSPVLSPDGTQFVLVRDGQLFLTPSAGGWPVRLTTTPGSKSGAAWSPDSSKLAYVSQGSIWVVSAAGGAPLRLTDAPAGSGDPRQAADRSPRWSPKGKWILFETGRRGNNDLMVVSEDGMSTHFVTMTGDDESAAAWSPDGTRISYTARAAEYFSGRLLLMPFDPRTGRAAGEPTALHAAPNDRGGGWSIPTASWSPDGRSLAVVLQHSGWDKVYLIPSGGGEPKALTTGEYDDTSPVFSPDGKYLAAVSNRRNLEERHIWILPVDGSVPRPLTQSDRASEGSPQWSPDGNSIYFLRSSPLEPQNLLVAATTGKADP
ncbi:MAG: S9 family peptidase, partial [Acidobacteria bacterium]|nr:S9 family peptidase [Acidobacteriota bacterium]